MPAIDLHAHSTISDGLLSPEAVVTLAAQRGGRVFALTDHDDVSGLAAARACAEKLGLRFVSGVEISVTYSDRVTLHVVGLAVDEQHPLLAQGLAQIRHGRLERAKLMGEGLAKAGIPGAFAGAQARAQNPEIISRTHFARFLVETGVVKDVKSVFKRYLVRGKPGYVKHTWASLSDAIAWIHAAGGVAVLAHPGRYDIGRSAMLDLLKNFKALGGDGIEVVTANHHPEQVQFFAQQAALLELKASLGSDYHGPGETYFEPGVLPELPAHLQPIWRDFLPEQDWAWAEAPVPVPRIEAMPAAESH